MREPRRLLDGEGTDFERALLGAVANERPTKDLERRMRYGVGLVGVGVGAGAAAKAAPASWGQVIIAGMVAAGIVGGGAVAMRRDARHPESVPVVAATPTPRAPEPVAAAVPEAPAGVAVDALPKAQEPVRRGPAPAAVPDVRDEIKLLDQARSLVRSGASTQALGVLKKYDQRFPRGQFRQEVLVLRMEALENSGDSQRASALGRKFLAQHPDSPHFERVERVTSK